MPEVMTDTLHERVTIAGPRRLDGELAYPVSSAVRGAAVLLNPHPYMGGSMRNNVIARLHPALAEAGFITLRFDYSGVGSSEGQPIDVAASMAAFWADGHAPVDPLMIEDAAAAMRWLRETSPEPLLLVGYSFGCHVAASVAGSDAIGLAMISPTIVHHDFKPGFARSRPTLAITSDNDFATPADRFDRWLNESAADIAEHHRLTGAQHFFLDQEQHVCDIVTAFARSCAINAAGATSC